MKTLLAAKDRLIAIALILLGGIIFFLRSMQSARDEGREEIKEEFQANDIRQADEIRKEVEWTKRTVADLTNDAVVDGLRQDGGLRRPDSNRDSESVG